MLVIKIGGSVRDPEPLLQDVVRVGEPLVLLHGASRELNELSQRLGHPPRMVTSVRGEVSRYTDSTSMDHFLMAYAGVVNKRLVARLRALGADAVGLTALDGGIAVGRRKPDMRIRDGDRVRVLHDDHSGTIERVEPRLLRLLLDDGRLPVLCPPAISNEGEPINVDGDRLAMEIAVALGAERLLIFSDAPGLLRDVDDESSLVTRIGDGELPAALEHARGRARVKLRSAGRALERGLDLVILADGRSERPIAAALAGGGTWVTR